MTMTLAQRLVAAPKLANYTDALAPALIGLAEDNDPMILLAAVATASRLALDTSFTADLGDKVNDYTAQFRAAGGPIEAGRPYVVGERGPELIVPRMSGHVIPNHKLGGAGFTINVDARGATDPAMVAAAAKRAVYEAAPAIIAASTKNTMDRANRRQLPRGLG